MALRVLYLTSHHSEEIVQHIEQVACSYLTAFERLLLGNFRVTSSRQNGHQTMSIFVLIGNYQVKSRERIGNASVLCWLPDFPFLPFCAERG
jgi:hypothetical protein